MLTCLPVVLVNVAPSAPTARGSTLAVTDICYVSVILKVDSEPVISFFNKGKSFFGDLLFCNFVRNTIYVIEVEMLEPVVLARYLKFEDVTSYNLSVNHYTLNDK